MTLIQPDKRLGNLSSYLNSDTFGSELAQGRGGDAVAAYAQGQLKKAEDDETTKALTSLVRDWYARATGARAQFEQQWYKNLDMAQGRQFTYWNNTEKKMTETKPADFEPRLPVNVIEPVMRTELAKTGSSHPSVSVSPASTDESDIMAAQAGNKVWAWFYDVSDFQVLVFNQANFWRAHTGMGFIKVFTDLGAVDEAAMEAARRQQAPGQDALAGALANMPNPVQLPPTPPKPVYGKICAERVSPFNIWVGDLLQPDLQRQPYVIHGYLMALEQAKIKYKDFLPENYAPERGAASQLIDATHIGVRGGNDQLKDQVLVLEFWVKPGTTNYLPKGGLVVMVGDRVVAVAKDGLPYQHGLYPFGMLSGIETGGFYRKSVIQSLIPLQDELNRIFAQLIKYKNMVIRPQMLYDEGSVDPSRVVSKAGLWIPVRLGMKRPEPITLPSLPNAVADLLNRLREVIDDISGQHQVSRAQAPGANTPASALSLMQETDDNFLSPTFDSIEMCLKHVGRMVLSNAQQFWDQPRYIRVVGEDSSVDAEILQGADLEGGTDLRVETGSGLPMSKSARIATVTDWMKQGFISPELGMKVLDFGMFDKVYSILRVDEDQAIRENLQIEKMDAQQLAADRAAFEGQQAAAAAVAPEQQVGQMMQAGANPFAAVDDPALGLQADPAAAAQMAPPQPEPFRAIQINDYDNHPVHAAVHARQMKSQGFQAWPPEKQQALLQHYNDHVAAAAAQGIMITGSGAGPAPQPAAGPVAGYAESDQQQQPAPPQAA